jgi:predicted lysophospholipase L1 biosynthesis ABC-type transport system permease subunit
MAGPRLINSPVSSTLLLVGAIGIANGTVIGVLERRGEIGLCPALGAGRRHIRYQFLTESVLLSAVRHRRGGYRGSRSPLVRMPVRRLRGPSPTPTTSRWSAP